MNLSLSRRILSGVAVFVAACSAPLVSTPLSGELVEGIPYFLPKAQVELTVSGLKGASGKQDDLEITVATTLVPDGDQGFVLTSKKDWFTEREIAVRVKDSMLTLASTEDTSRVADVVAALVSIASNLVVFGETGGTSSAGEKVSDDSDPKPSKKPTADDVTAVFRRVAPGKHTVAVGEDPGAGFLIPGTGGRLRVQAAFGSLEAPRTTRAAEPKELAKPYAGIYTRVVTPRNVTSILFVSKELIYRDRIAKISSLDTAVGAAMSAKEEIEKKLRAPALTPARKAALEKQLETAKKTLKAASQGRTNYVTIHGDANQNDEWAKQAAEPSSALSFFEVGRQINSILVPDPSKVVRLPVKRAGLGKSTTKIELVSGILTSYETKRPSEALEFVSIPLNITERLLELPGRILQLRVDYSNRNKELLEAEKAIADLQTQINAAPSVQTAAEVELLRLEQAAQVLRLRKEIAELEAAILELD